MSNFQRRRQKLGLLEPAQTSHVKPQAHHMKTIVALGLVPASQIPSGGSSTVGGSHVRQILYIVADPHPLSILPFIDRAMNAGSETLNLNPCN